MVPSDVSCRWRAHATVGSHAGGRARRGTTSRAVVVVGSEASRARIARCLPRRLPARGRGARPVALRSKHLPARRPLDVLRPVLALGRGFAEASSAQPAAHGPRVPLRAAARRGSRGPSRGHLTALEPLPARRRASPRHGRVGAAGAPESADPRASLAARLRLGGVASLRPHVARRLPLRTPPAPRGALGEHRRDRLLLRAGVSGALRATAARECVRRPAVAPLLRRANRRGDAAESPRRDPRRAGDRADRVPRRDRRLSACGIHREPRGGDLSPVAPPLPSRPRGDPRTSRRPGRIRARPRDVGSRPHAVPRVPPRISDLPRARARRPVDPAERGAPPLLEPLRTRLSAHGRSEALGREHQLRGGAAVHRRAALGVPARVDLRALLAVRERRSARAPARRARTALGLPRLRMAARPSLADLHAALLLQQQPPHAVPDTDRRRGARGAGGARLARGSPPAAPARLRAPRRRDRGRRDGHAGPRHRGPLAAPCLRRARRGRGPLHRRSRRGLGRGAAARGRAGADPAAPGRGSRLSGLLPAAPARVGGSSPGCREPAATAPRGSRAARGLRALHGLEPARGLRCRGRARVRLSRTAALRGLHGGCARGRELRDLLPRGPGAARRDHRHRAHVCALAHDVDRLRRRPSRRARARLEPEAHLPLSPEACVSVRRVVPGRRSHRSLRPSRFDRALPPIARSAARAHLRRARSGAERGDLGAVARRPRGVALAGAAADRGGGAGGRARATAGSCSASATTRAGARCPIGVRRSKWFRRRCASWRSRHKRAPSASCSATGRPTSRRGSRWVPRGSSPPRPCGTGVARGAPRERAGALRDAGPAWRCG